MSTHINAQAGAIAESILLPGDPLRAKYIAEKFFEEPVLFNAVRGMYGYTGSYKGKRLSVMGTGMGIPSISIYANELFNDYNVKNAIRVGTCGSLREGMVLGDVILAEGCCTDSDINRLIFPGTYAPTADFTLLRNAYKKALSMGKRVYVGNVLSGDMFYGEDEMKGMDMWIKYGCIAVEMEGAGLYTAAKKYGRRALCLLTVSDGPKDENGNEVIMPSADRERKLDDMISIALETACEL